MYAGNKKSVFPRIADVVTAIVVLALGGGIVWSGCYLFLAELHGLGVSIERSILIVVILAAAALTSGYTAYRFIHSAFRATK